MGDPGSRSARRYPVSRSGRWAAGMLIGLAIVAWAATIRWGMQMGSMRTHAHPMGAAFFLVMWGVMQAAMMFPSVLFMATAFANISERQGGTIVSVRPPSSRLPCDLDSDGSGGLPSLARAAGGNGREPGCRPVDRSRHPRRGGPVPVVAPEIPLPVALSKPFELLHAAPRGKEPIDGLRLGLYHGAYCVACCWALMAVLFAVGLMNLGWMGLLTVAIFVEKAYRQGHRVGQLTGVALIVLGLLLLGGPPWIQQSLIGQ